MNLNEAVVADRRRTAQGSMPGPRRAVAGVPPRFDEGVKVLVFARGRIAPVRVRDGRVIGAGTAPELQRLVGLAAAGLRAYAAARGWRLVGMPDDAGGRS